MPFDQDSLEVQGNPVLVVDGVESYTVANVAAYSIADNGTLGTNGTVAVLALLSRRRGPAEFPQI